MSIPNTGQRKVRPTHPGEMIREDFLPEYGLTVSGLAGALGVSRPTMNELLRERRAVWLNAQWAVEIYL
jgi:addiction module HigA family antidote